MRLAKARIQNYRGIRSADIEFGDLTVLIGENGCGKSSLLNALEACLGRKVPEGSFDFQPRDVYIDDTEGKASSLQIELSFEEEEAASAVLLEPLREAGLADHNGLLNFDFRVQASPQNGDFEVSWEMSRGSFTSSDVALLKQLRTACPYVRIRCGALPKFSVEAQSENPVLEQIRTAFRSIMESKSPPPGLVEEVTDYLHDFIRKFEKEGKPASLQDRLEAPMKSPAELAWLVRHLQGAGIQRLALLAMAAVFIEGRGPGPLDEGSSPLITLEEPEVHLHPLASRTVWSLLNPLSAQKLITTNSPDLLSAAPLSSVRRMTRERDGKVAVFGPKIEMFDSTALRRAAYHVRIRRGSSLFMRAWLLVEGESEFWLLNEVARVCGYELAYEGVACVEFAQSGLPALVRLAASLGIRWHVLCDGDQAGLKYREEAERLMKLGGGSVFQLRERDLENCLWKNGYEGVFRREAGHVKKSRSKDGRKAVIKQAVRNLSKPQLALVIAEEMRRRGRKGAPPALRKLIEQVVSSARQVDPLSR